MRAAIPLIFFLLVFLSQTYAETIGNISGYWKLSFEITNTNPYTVFVAIPYELEFTNKPLIFSKDFNILNVLGNIFTYQDSMDFYTILNGELGFWIPPYTKVNVYRRGNFTYLLNTNDFNDEYKVVGPALVNNIMIFNEKEQMDLLYKEGVRVNNYRLYVRGKFLKSQDSNVVSIVIPAPLVLKDYSKFNKIIGKGDVDIWVDSYNDYIRGHEKISYKMHPELYDAFNDDTLIPRMLTEPDDVNMNIKLFDVPAMVFTTSDNSPIEFSYVMYSYDMS